MFDIFNKSHKLNPIAKPLELEGQKDNLIILIHGYTGTPREMKELGKFLYKKLNFSISIPRLPGHGTDRYDFLNTDRKDWLRKIYDLIIEKSSVYENIHLIGLSMGSLISLMSALHFDVKSLLLVSPALYPKNKQIILTHLIKYFKPVLENDFKIDPKIKDPNLIKLYKNYSTNDFSKQLSELHKLMFETRKILKDIKIKIKILHSKKDDLVPLKAAEDIFDKVSSSDKELIIFENSPHVINYGVEKDKMFNEVLKFFKA